VKFGGRRTERQWDRWDKSNELENLKIHTIFQLQTVTGTGTLGDLGLVEIFEAYVMNWTQRIKISVPFRSVK